MRSHLSALLASLKQCGSSRDLERARTIHAAVVQSGDVSSVKVATSLVDVYAKCGSMAEASKVFYGMSHQDTAAWTALILGYVDNGEESLALQLFFRIVSSWTCVPDARLFVAVLKGCRNLAVKERARQVEGALVKVESLQTGKILHGEALRCGCVTNTFVANTLVDMYARCGYLEGARSVFDRMEHRRVVSWTALILGYAENGEGRQALELYARMRAERCCAPDARIFVALLKACTCLQMSALQAGMATHADAAGSQCDSEIYVASTMVDMYAKLGSTINARRVFEAMAQRNVISWNALMFGYVENGEGQQALHVYQRMQQDPACVPDARTFVAALKACTILATKSTTTNASPLDNAMDVHAAAAKSGLSSEIYVASTLVDTYCKCGSLELARDIFESMRQRDLVSWTALMLGYLEKGEPNESLELYTRMKSEGLTPDAAAMVAGLKACGLVVALEAGRAIHGELGKCGLETDPSVLNTLVDFYGKCGSMSEAQEIFDSVTKNNKDLVTWNALLSGYSHQADIQRTLAVFSAMQDQGYQPDAFTFSCLLNACSHAGLVDQGKSIFDSMTSIHGLEPDIKHYVCMVDLLGRANRLEEAVYLVRSSPVEANVVAWKSLLGAGQKWKNVEIGRRAFDELVKLDKVDAAAYATMANIYRSTGQWRQAFSMSIPHNSYRKTPGWSSWTDSSGFVHSFFASALHKHVNLTMTSKLRA